MLALLLFIPAAVWAQPPAVLTLEQLEATALARNPTLAAAGARVDAARGKWLQVGLKPNPDFGYAATEIGNEGRAGQQGLYYQQEFVTGGKLGLNRRVAAGEIRAAEMAFHAQRLRVLTDVRTQYFAVLAAQRRLKMAKELVEIGQRGADAAKRQFDAKVRGVTKADELRAQVQTETARLTVIEANNRLLGAQRRLAAVLGVPDCGGVQVAGSLDGHMPYRDWDEALCMLMEHSPQRGAALARVGRAQAALSRAVAEPIPNFTLQAQAQFDTSTEDMITSIQASVPIPIHNRNQGNILAARAELTAARQEVGRIELSLRWRLAEAFQRYMTARGQAGKYASDILPKASDAMEIAERAYRNNLVRYTTVLDSQRTFFQAELAQIEALRELHQSAVAIDGLLLSGSLEPIE